MAKATQHFALPRLDEQGKEPGEHGFTQYDLLY